MGKSLQEDFQNMRFWKRVTNKNESSMVDGTLCDENGVVSADEIRVMN